MRKEWLLILLSMAIPPAGRADSVTLVSGEKISGTIKEQTDAEVTIEVPVSASITDERTIRKEDIAHIDKEAPDEIAYQSLRLLEPNPQRSYAFATYDQILDSLRHFETAYPASAHVAEIKQKEAAFQAEKQKVDAGQVKYLGEWLTKEQTGRRRIQITAMDIYGAMQQQAAGGDLAGAMQTFERLEKGYGTTRAYPAAVELAVQVLPRLQQQLASRAQALVADQAQMKQTLLATPEPEKSNLIASAKMEQERNDAVIRAALHSGVKWVPLIPRGQLSISTLQATASAELSRLRSVPVAAMAQSIGQVDVARKAIASRDFPTATAALAKANQLWAQNEAAHYWTDRLKEATATPTPRPKASPSPSAPLRPAASMRPSPSPALAAQPPPPQDKPFLLTPLGMTSTGLAVAVLVAWGLSALQKKNSIPQ